MCRGGVVGEGWAFHSFRWYVWRLVVFVWLELLCSSLRLTWLLLRWLDGCVGWCSVFVRRLVSPVSRAKFSCPASVIGKSILHH